LSDGDVSVADKLLTYGGKKLLLTGTRRPAPAPRHAGLFGDDNDLLKQVQHIVQKSAEKQPKECHGFHLVASAANNTPSISNHAGGSGVASIPIEGLSIVNGPRPFVAISLYRLE